MRRRCEIGIRQAIASKPVSVADQIADIAQMITYIRARRAHAVHIGCAAASRRGHESFIDFLRHKPIRHFVKKLMMKPVKEPPHFDTLEGRIGEEPVIAQPMPMDVVKIFGDCSRAGNNFAGVSDKDRRLPRRIEHQELFSPRKCLFFDQSRVDSIFA